MNQRDTWFLRTTAVFVDLLGVLIMSASAMHIAEGYLPVGWAAGWGAVCAPFVVAGFFSVQKKIVQAPEVKIPLAMCGAFAFAFPVLKIPSITSSCSRPTGVGLGAILSGPMTMAVLGLIVLLFQALLLAHGGLTTLGANTSSMAITGPIVPQTVYKLLRKVNALAAVAVFIATVLGDLSTYVVTSVQLGVVNGSTGKFLMVFAVAQIPLVIAEGLLTVVVFNVLEKYSRKEFHALCVLQGGSRNEGVAEKSDPDRIGGVVGGAAAVTIA